MRIEVQSLDESRLQKYFYANLLRNIDDILAPSYIWRSEPINKIRYRKDIRLNCTIIYIGFLTPYRV